MGVVSAGMLQSDTKCERVDAMGQGSWTAHPSGLNMGQRWDTPCLQSGMWGRGRMSSKKGRPWVTNDDK